MILLSKLQAALYVYTYKDSHSFFFYFRWSSFASMLLDEEECIKALSFTRSFSGGYYVDWTGGSCTGTILDLRGGTFIAASYYDGCLLTDSLTIKESATSDISVGLQCLLTALQSENKICSEIAKDFRPSFPDWTIGLTATAAFCKDALIALLDDKGKSSEHVTASDSTVCDIVAMAAGLRTCNDWQNWITKKEWTENGNAALQGKGFWIECH